MEELLSKVGEYVANHPMHAYQTAMTAASAYVGYNLVRGIFGSTESFRKEAEALSNEELTNQISGLDASFYLKETGPEFDPSWENAMLMFDGLFRSDRSLKKLGFVEEARERDLDPNKYLEDT